MASRIKNDAPLEEGTSITGGETFDEFASSMPDNAKTGFDILPPEGTDEGFGVMTGEGDGDQINPSDTAPRKKLKMSRKMKAAMNKIKEKVGSFPILYFSNKAKVHPEWALDDDEKEIITDSLTFVFDVLDINFEIEALNITLTSIWWIIAYPIAAIGMIFFTHQSAVKIAHPDETEETK